MQRNLILLVGLLLPSMAIGQFNPYATQQNYDARWRRALIERAVMWSGGQARALVEAHPDSAPIALLGCSRHVARKLSEFHASGGLARLPNPSQLLNTIAQAGAGDDVARWAMQHESELMDQDCFEAYCSDPLIFALNLKPLAEGGAEIRANRLSAQAAMQPATTWTTDRRTLAIIAAVGILGFLIWRWRRNQSEF
jgi:hypothetical protein